MNCDTFSFFIFLWSLSFWNAWFTSYKYACILLKLSFHADCKAYYDAKLIFSRSHNLHVLQHKEEYVLWKVLKKLYKTMKKSTFSNVADFYFLEGLSKVTRREFKEHSKVTRKKFEEHLYTRSALEEHWKGTWTFNALEHLRYPLTWRALGHSRTCVREAPYLADPWNSTLSKNN